MKLSKNATIAPEKLYGYLLLWRPVNDKSKFLSSAGYTNENWQTLKRDLQEQILPLEAEEIERTKYGVVYKISGALRGPNNKVLLIKTIWMKETVSGETKFITLYPAK